MLQVADPRPAPEERLLPATPLHSRPEWFLNLKGGKKQGVDSDFITEPWAKKQGDDVFTVLAWQESSL